MSAKVLVYDLQSGKWSIFRYLSDANLNDAAVYNGTFHVLRNSDRTIYAESATFSDAGAWYGVTLTTGDIGFGNPAILQRVKGLGLMIDRFGTGGLSVEVSRDGGAFTSPAYNKTQAEMAVLNDDTLRITLREQRGRRWRIRVKETTSSTPDKGFGFVGLNFETASIGGSARVGANGRMG